MLRHFSQTFGLLKKDDIFLIKLSKEERPTLFVKRGDGFAWELSPRGPQKNARKVALPKTQLVLKVDATLSDFTKGFEHFFRTSKKQPKLGPTNMVRNNHVARASQR